MDARTRQIRDCALFLEEHHGGDAEAACLRQTTRAALELCAELLARRGAPPARGYKDACDKLVDCGVLGASAAATLKEVFDVGDRAATAWSSLEPGELARVRERGAGALRALADAAARELGEGASGSEREYAPNDLGG